MNNPFYVQQADIGAPIMAGVGNMQANQERRSLEDASRSSEQAVLEEGAALLRGDNPDAIAEYMLKNPQMRDRFISAADLQDKYAKKPRIDTAKDVLSGQIDGRAAYQARYDEIVAGGGSAENLKKALDDPNANFEAWALKDLSVLDPELYKSIGGGKQSDTVRLTEFKRWQDMPDSAEKDALGRIIGATSKRESYEDYVARKQADADIKLSSEQDMNTILAERAKGKVLSSGQASKIDSYISSGLDAYDRLPQVKRGLELVDQVSQGGLAATSKKVSDFFGTTSGDVSELNKILAENVLAGLANFTGAISEGERQFLERMETNLASGGEFNRRELERMRRELEKQINRAKYAAKISKDKFALGILSGDIDGGARTQAATKKIDPAIMSEYESALAKGVPKDKLIQRMKENGLDTEGL